MKRVSAAFFLSILATSVPLTGGDWSMHVTGGVIVPNGEFNVTRPNGKVVRTDIEDATSVTLGIERRLTRRISIEIDIEMPEDQTIWHRQDLPNGEVHIERDDLSAKIWTISFPIELLPSARDWSLSIAPSFAFVQLGDVNLGTAGPPYDLERPLNLDIRDDSGGGLRISLARKIRDDRWRIRFVAFLAALRVQGNIRNDPDDPEPDHDLDLPYNPLSIGLGVTYRF